MNLRLLKIAARIKAKRGWRPGPPVSLEEVEVLESKYTFRLPEEYKDFITQIGNGGELPPLHDEDECRMLPFADIPALERVGKNFPLIESWEWDTDPDFSPDSPEGEKKWTSVQENGVIPLAREEVGGGQSWFLVVTGSRRGEVWERDEGGVTRMPGCTFLDWVELYLNKKLTPYMDKLFQEEKEKREAQKARDPIGAIRSLMAGKWGKEIRWNPPASLEEVRAFEERHNITLPEPYVTFITQIADGCENFLSPNSHGTGGTFFSLAQMDPLTKLGEPFCFTENNEEVRQELTNSFRPGGYGPKNPIWTARFGEEPRETPPSPVWASEDYSVLGGVLPFGAYHDTIFNTQACLIVTGPLKGQVWFARRNTIVPQHTPEENFYTWITRMLEGMAR